MKKMNKKGFTLIELLAVIVVLAIILVITIPTVLGSLSNARLESFKASANAAADWFEKQYSYCAVGDANINSGALSGDYTAIKDSTGCTIGKPASGSTYTAKDISSLAALKSSGLNSTDFSATVYVKDNGRACVTITAKSGGKFDSLKAANGTDQLTHQSSGC